MVLEPGIVHFGITANKAITLLYRSAAILTFLLTVSCTQDQQGPITIQDAWVREAPPNVYAMVGYLTLHNSTQEDCALTCAKSKYFKEIEFHRTIIKDSVAKMRHQDSLAIPASGSLVLKLGDFHLMLMGPRTSFKAGNELPMTLCVMHGNKQEELDITVPVKTFRSE